MNFEVDQDVVATVWTTRGFQDVRARVAVVRPMDWYDIVADTNETVINIYGYDDDYWSTQVTTGTTVTVHESMLWSVDAWSRRMLSL